MTTYLSDYANFNSIEEMDNASSQHVSANWNQLNDTDRAVLDMIRRYSVKHGAAHLKHKTMEKTLSKSNSTIRRSLRKLESLSIIKRIKFVRKVMNGIGANIYTILPFTAKDEQGRIAREEIPENSSVSKLEVTKSENEPSFYKSSKDFNSINTYPEAPMNFYSRFKSFVVSLLGEGSQALISKLFGVYKAQSIRMLKFSIYEDKLDQFEALCLQGIAITLQASKKKPIKSITGFFSGVYSNLIARHIIGIESDYREGQSTTEDIEWSMPV